MLWLVCKNGLTSSEYRITENAFRRIGVYFNEKNNCVQLFDDDNHGNSFVFWMAPEILSALLPIIANDIRQLEIDGAYVTGERKELWLSALRRNCQEVLTLLEEGQNLQRSEPEYVSANHQWDGPAVGRTEQKPTFGKNSDDLIGVLAEIYKYAAKGKRVTYRTFIEHSWPCANMRELFDDLNRAMVDDFENARPFLAALIVSEKTGIPGFGFYRKAAELGRYGGATEGIAARSFADLEARKAIEYWGGLPTF